MTTFNVEYWMIASQGFDIIQEPAVATPDNPEARGGQSLRPFVRNEVIAEHPALHALRFSSQDSGIVAYAIIWATPITKQMFEHVMGPERLEKFRERQALNQKVVNIAEGRNGG